jgi:dihydropteroate synthase
MAELWTNGHCRVMGILNVTPDSFSDGNEFFSVDKAVSRALEMQSEGASLIDIGAESTRPGSDSVAVDEQISRLKPVLEKLIPQLKVPVSIDSTKVAVLQACFDLGAVAVNDTSAGTEDPDMLAWVSERQCPIVLMHRSSQPKEMQAHTDYNDVVEDVSAYLFERAALFETAGLAQNLICLDPGIGFGKTCDQNLALTAQLGRLSDSAYATLYGASRKSFIGEILDEQEPRDRDIGSVAVALYAATQKVDWVRVHNVKDTVQSLKMQIAVKASGA